MNHFPSPTFGNVVNGGDHLHLQFEHLLSESHDIAGSRRRDVSRGRDFLVSPLRLDVFLFRRRRRLCLCLTRRSRRRRRRRSVFFHVPKCGRLMNAIHARRCHLDLMRPGEGWGERKVVV